MEGNIQLYCIKLAPKAKYPMLTCYVVNLCTQKFIRLVIFSFFCCFLAQSIKSYFFIYYCNDRSTNDGVGK